MLTTWLAPLETVNQPENADLSSTVKPVGLKITSKPRCDGCPAEGEPGHLSYFFAQLMAALPSDTRPRYATLRIKQRVIERMHRDYWGLIGSEAGFLYNAKASYNYADVLGWNIVSADGTTLVLQATEDARNQGIYSYRVPSPDLGPNGVFYISSTVYGVIQAGDVIKFGAPSVLAGKSQPRVLQILDYDDETFTVTVRVSQNVTNAMVSGDAGNPDPLVFKCGSWRQAGDRPKWQQVIEPSEFRGYVQERVFLVSRDLDAGGRVRLKDSAGADTLAAGARLADAAQGIPQTFKCEGWNTETKQWVDLSAAMIGGRFKQETVSASYRTTLCFGTQDHTGAEVFSDLTATYSHFRVWYVSLATASEIERNVAINPSVQCRCKWSRRDYSNSVGNWHAPDGVGIDGDGKHWYCALRRYDLRTMVDTDDDLAVDTIVIDILSPTGVENYPSDGRCMQQGVCDKWEELAFSGVETEPFNAYRTYARYYKGLWASVDTVMRQLMPGFPIVANLNLERVGNPSLMGMAGIYQLATPAGIHEQAFFLDTVSEGGPVFGTFTVVTDEDGNEDFEWTWGAFWNLGDDVSEAVFGDPETYPRPGLFPLLVDGWTDQHDPLEYDDLLDDDTDPHLDGRRHLERVGWNLERDSGAVVGTGYSDNSHAVRNDEPMLAQGVSLTTVDQLQDRTDCTFLRLSTPQLVLGMDAGAKIAIKRMATMLSPITFKPADALGSVEVHSITSLGGGLWRIVLKNVEHRNSYIAGPSGSRYDLIETFLAGGNPLLFPVPEFFRINNYYEFQKYIGPMNFGATRGRCIGFTGEYNDVDMTGKRFTIAAVEPHGDDAAATWGDDEINRAFAPGGYWQADEVNLELETVEGVGTTYGDIYGPSFVVSSSISAGATSIELEPPAPIRNGVRLKNRNTGEVIRVTGSPSYGSTSVTVSIAGTAAAHSAGDVIIWQIVTDHATGTPLTRRADVERPDELLSGEYWVDTRTARVYARPTGGNIDIRYAVQGQTATEAHAYESIDQAIASYADWSTGVNYSDLSGYTKTVSYTKEVGTLTLAGGAPSARGEYQLINSGGTAVIRCHVNEAGRPMMLHAETGATAAAPSLNAEYLARGKKRDRITVIDHSGFLAEVASALPGAQMTVYKNDGVQYCRAGDQLQVAKFRTVDWETVPSESVILENGFAYIAEDYLQTLQEEKGAEVCFKL